MGSAGAGRLHAFGVTQTPEQDGCILKPSTLLYFHRALVKRSAFVQASSEVRADTNGIVPPTIIISANVLTDIVVAVCIFADRDAVRRSYSI
jgi:hypothetical protein